MFKHLDEDKYPKLTISRLKISYMFGSICMCELAFSDKKYNYISETI